MSNLNPKFAYLKNSVVPLWLKGAIAEIEAGVSETPGTGSTKRILQYRQMAKIEIMGDDGQIPWCAIAANAMLENAHVRGTRSAMARSFINDGHFSKIAEPMLGAITVLSSNRGAASGHVGFYVGENGLFVFLAGGNQNDEYSIGAFRKDKVLGYFWPNGSPHLPAKGAVKITSPKTNTQQVAASDF